MQLPLRITQLLRGQQEVGKWLVESPQGSCENLKGKIPMFVLLMGT